MLEAPVHWGIKNIGHGHIFEYQKMYLVFLFGRMTGFLLAYLKLCSLSWVNKGISYFSLKSVEKRVVVIELFPPLI